MLHRTQPCSSTHAPTHPVSTRTASRWPLLRRSSGNVFRTAWTFYFLSGTQQLHLQQRQCPTRDSSGSTSALAEMSSQASSRSLLGDHLCLHHRPGLPPPPPSSNSCSKRWGCVRLSLLEAIEAIHTAQTFSGRPWRRASLSSFLWRKTAPQLAFSVLGTNYVTGHCAIEDRPWGRALPRRAGREGPRRFLQTALWGKTSRWWKFHFWVYLPFKKKKKKRNSK